MQAADAGKILLFRVGGILHGADMGKVIKVVAGGNLTPVPRTPDRVKGVILHEGKVVPVFSCRKSGKASNAENLVLLMEHRDGPIGLGIDKVIGVVQDSEIVSGDDAVKYRGEPVQMIIPENLVSPPIPDK